jgi:hypothetical protein
MPPPKAEDFKPTASPDQRKSKQQLSSQRASNIRRRCSDLKSEEARLEAEFMTGFPTRAVFAWRQGSACAGQPGVEWQGSGSGVCEHGVEQIFRSTLRCYRISASSPWSLEVHRNYKSLPGTSAKPISSCLKRLKALLRPVLPSTSGQCRHNCDPRIKDCVA